VNDDRESILPREVGKHARGTLHGRRRRSATGVNDLPRFRYHSETAPSVTVVIPTSMRGPISPTSSSGVPAWIDEVIIVDGHSTDDTVEVAKSVRPDITVIFQNGRGKGNAIIGGIEAATSDVVVLLDADGSTDPADIPRFVAALRTGADFAKGTRFVMGGGSADLTPLRRFGSKAFAKFVNRLFGSNYTDVLYGYNAFWRRCMNDLNIDCDGFEVEPLLAIRALRSNIRVVEVPSFEPKRLSGISKLHAARDGMRILRMILGEWIRPG